MPEQWQIECAIRMSRTLARTPRKHKTRAYLATLPPRPKVVVAPEEFPQVSRHEARLTTALQAVRDAQRYADWEARGKPPSPSKPRRDRLRPGARRGRDPLRERLHIAQGGLCGICSGRLPDAEEWTIDHVVPRALGGRNAGNVLLAHYACNNAKADRPPTRSELEMLAVVNAALARIDARSDATPKCGDDD